LVDGCPHWDDGRGVCCEVMAHFSRRVQIGELQMVARYAKLLQDPKSAVANSCASLPWRLFYTEKYVLHLCFLSSNVVKICADKSINSAGTLSSNF
jgi:hypothetical protein